MKSITALRIIIWFLLFGIDTSSLSAQQVQPKLESIVNKWSFEINFGTNRAVRPFGTGYNSNEKEFLSSPSLNHFDFGFRYMLNSKFGIKTDFGFDAITNKSGNGSLPFKSMQSRFGLQGVFDLGKVFEFDTFTKSIGLLAHGGIQFSQFKAKTGTETQEAAVQTNGGFMIGITPQIKLSERTLLTLDFTALSNVRQRLNWDGTESARENNLAGLLYTSSLGLTFYLGKNEKHSDWVIVEKTTKVKTELLNRISTLEALLVDTDKDGVADVKDLQNNTPSGLNVNARGQFIDTDNNGTPDELEVEKIQEIKAQNLAAVIEQSENNTFKLLLKNGLVNIFYDINKDEPNNASTNSIYGIISLLRNNPSYKIKLTGYSDRTGSESANKNLSERRVKKIYDIILLGGIAPERIKIIGEGVDNSISSNSKTALQLARRVSVVIE